MEKDVYAEVTNMILSELDKGVVLWRKPWNGAPRNITTKKNYRGVNIWALNAVSFREGYESNDWLTYRQATGLGGHVRKGEHGTTIVFWRFFDREKVDPDGEVKIDRIPLARAYTAFNTAQCEGLPNKDKGLSKVDSIAGCDAIVKGYLDPPVIKYGGDRAFYRPKADLVGMPPIQTFDNSPAYYSTAFHELTHSTGHSKRLERFNGKDSTFGSEDYSVEELVAEMGAAFLMGTAGGKLVSKTVGNTAAYIAHWRQKIKEDKRLIFRTSSAAQKAADWIISADRM